MSHGSHSATDQKPRLDRRGVLRASAIVAGVARAGIGIANAQQGGDMQPSTAPVMTQTPDITQRMIGHVTVVPIQFCDACAPSAPSVTQASPECPSFACHG